MCGPKAGSESVDREGRTLAADARASGTQLEAAILPRLVWCCSSNVTEEHGRFFLSGDRGMDDASGAKH